MKKIYVSATCIDLEKYRKRATSTIRKMDHISMENYVAEDKRPLDKCLEDVATCDLYVGIFAWRYGHIPPGYDKSITELEYRKAKECDKPRLIFLLKDDAHWPANLRDDNIEKIKNLRKELENDRILAYFSSIDELGARLTEGIHKWEKDKKVEGHIEFASRSDDTTTIGDSEKYRRMFYNLKIRKKDKSEIVNDLTKCVATVSFIDKDNGDILKQIKAHWEKNPEPRINEEFVYHLVSTYNEKDIGYTEEPFNILIKYDEDKGFYVANPWIVYKYPNNPQEWEKENLRIIKDEVILRVEIKCSNLIKEEITEYLLKNKGIHKEDIEIIRFNQSVRT